MMASGLSSVPIRRCNVGHIFRTQSERYCPVKVTFARLACFVSVRPPEAKQRCTCEVAAQNFVFHLQQSPYFPTVLPTGVSRSQETAFPWDPTVGLCLGPYGSPGGGRFLMSKVPLYRRAMDHPLPGHSRNPVVVLVRCVLHSSSNEQTMRTYSRRCDSLGADFEETCEVLLGLSLYLAADCNVREVLPTVGLWIIHSRVVHEIPM